MTWLARKTWLARSRCSGSAPSIGRCERIRSSRRCYREALRRSSTSRFDLETLRALPAPPNVPHRLISAFEVTAQPIRIKERVGQSVLFELATQRAQAFRITGQMQSQHFVLFERLCNQFGEPDRMQLACRNAARKLAPWHVRTGSPAHSASLAVVCALYGSVSRNRSASRWRAK